ncbi:MAG: hypothetical protein K1X56_10865 [Flavobacteriales bacterium]|nr:hypothetical protein [Flavobacteriales bacterium]
MKFHLLFAFLLLFSLGKAGNDNLPVGARSAGLAHASLALNDAWAVQNNQASLAYLEQFSGGVYYENRFLIKDMNLSAAAFALPTKSGTFGLLYHSFSLSSYNESKAGISYGRKITENFAVGIGINYNSIRFGGIYGKGHTLTGEIGFRLALNKNLVASAHMYNITRSKLNTSNSGSEYIPSIMRFGLNYSISKKIFAALEAQKDVDHPLIIRAGAEYRVLDLIAIRAGISTNPTLNSFGFGFYFKDLVLDIAASYHQTLGFSPQVGLSYAPSKKKEKEIEP